MKRHLVLLIVAITLSTLGAYGGTDAKAEPRVLSLCELVDNWKDHTRHEVRVRAVYAVGAEQAVLYDPACQEGKDLTYVEFRPHAKGATKKLDQIVAKSRRAWVQLEGVFYGPELYTDVDPKLPPAMRERLEKSPRHYGHMDSMDTMISVTRVIEASEVAPDVPVEKTKPISVLQKQPGFVDLIALESEDKTERLVAISFWNTKHDAERYHREHYPHVAEILKPYLTSDPKVETFNVGQSTIHRISAGKAA